MFKKRVMLSVENIKIAIGNELRFQSRVKCHSSDINKLYILFKFE